MQSTGASSEDRAYMRRAIEIAIRIGILALLVFWSLWLLMPFALPVIWGAVIAVAIFPFFRRVRALLGGRNKTAATLITLVSLALLLVPSFLLVEGVIESTVSFVRGVHEGTVVVPPPPDKVADWPVVGEPVHKIWASASENLEAALHTYGPTLRPIGGDLLATAGSLAMAALQFALSLIIAGVFMATAASGRKATRRFGGRLAGERGKEFASLATLTIRSVAQGVVGVAIIQSLAALVGMLLVGVPSAAVWALAILILAVIQLPPVLILGPIIVYVFSFASTFGAILFMLWAILVSVSDSFLKPLLMGRGVDVPMLVILLGALGGMMMFGFFGLFVGAVVLALSYQLLMAWLKEAPTGVDPALGKT